MGTAPGANLRAPSRSAFAPHTYGDREPDRVLATKRSRELTRWEVPVAL